MARRMEGRGQIWAVSRSWNHAVWLRFHSKIRKYLYAYRNFQMTVIEMFRCFSVHESGLFPQSRKLNSLLMYKFLFLFFFLIMTRWTSLVAQWLKIHLPIERAQVPSLVWEDAIEQLSPCITTSGPTLWSPWAATPDPCSLSQSPTATDVHTPWNQCSAAREATATRSLCITAREQTLLTAAGASPLTATKTQHSQKNV